ncbi:nuclear transport factor 2 family protein [Phaeobacter inhibens]|uniref:nuclear transport factor 2 family protein n=1 Tax=Phaeobacter inhibens TaxID=221822 RepID=UPI0021A87C17|nr:nuclear transport factor 2 family protein [Phaeobacter inhibens]UWR70200.1 nuclear transport factor 2 family protein [Phaeobacter inhibens]
MTLLKKAAAAVLASTAATSAAAGPAENKATAVALLEQGLAKGDREFIRANVAEDYIQHNPQAADGREGLLGFVDFLETLDPPVQVNPVRVFGDENFVVIHQTAEFFGPKVIIDLFRFEDGKLVEHWDAIQDEVPETASGRSMIDGTTEITDLDRTEANKALVTGLVIDVLMGGDLARINSYIRADYMQHNPYVPDTHDGLKGFIAYLAENEISFGYTKLHNVVAEGNFVMTQAEGIYDRKPTAFYDLWRVEDGLIAEHWDAVQEIPTEFAHGNGMF